MTSQEPTFLSQSVNYLGFLSQQLGDLVGKTTLAHELIQNADDAKDDEGRLSASRIAFDVTDTALIVSNDAAFRKIDFDRMRDVASGRKRDEPGARTTGVFGLGFVSVYQVTDRPEIHSAGRTWILRPDNPEGKRIEQRQDPSITEDLGTLFRFPWAYKESNVRKALRVPTIDAAYINSFVDELKKSLPMAILFLKKLDRIELLRNGNPVGKVERIISDNSILVEWNGSLTSWQVLEGTFSNFAAGLKAKYRNIINLGRSAQVRVAVPDSPIDNGLLFATLPTEQSTGLPFHIDADFYPASNRKSIAFEDYYDPRSEWNRAAIRTAASAVQSNLIPLRDMYSGDARGLWNLLTRIFEVHEATKGKRRLPLSEFWKSLLPSLSEAPIMYTESAKWLVSRATRIPTGLQEEEAIQAFQDMGIEIIHRDLWNVRNLLTRRDIGIGRVTASDIYRSFKERGCIDEPVSSIPVESDQLDVLWRGIEGVLAKEQGRSKENAKSLLGACPLAPGLDGRLWPCHSALRADKRTREIFSHLIPRNETFLVRNGIPLFKQLCPQFTAKEAIEVLALLGAQRLEKMRKDGKYNPVAVLEWFEEHKHQLSADLCAQLANLPIFPSATNLRPLSELWLPGGFQDLLGVAEILDAEVPESLLSFLRSLGVRQLTFVDYAKEYVPRAFEIASSVDVGTKQKLLATLERHIGEIRDSDEVKRTLSSAWIVECKDGAFRQPSTAYFSNKEVNGVLGDWVGYALVPDNSELRRDFYRWLGVESRPRIADMLHIVNQTVTTKPTSDHKVVVIKILECIGLRWQMFDDADKSHCLTLRSKPWLPSEGDTSEWHSPDELYAAFDKNIFASQAKFLDASIRVQENIVGFLKWLGVNLSPQTFHVVGHLLACSAENVAPPDYIYSWLNDEANPNELWKMKDAACLWINGTYVRPDQVYWGSHPFGSHRSQLGPSLLMYQDLLEGLGVRERPNFKDAINVLKEVSIEAGKRILEEEDKNVVVHCWDIISEALEMEHLDRKSLRELLGDISSIPTMQHRLFPPSWMFIKDRPGLTDKFPGILDQNCIPRTERVWKAMEAGGVRRVSEVIRAYELDYVNPCEDALISKRVTERIGLIAAILEDTASTTQELGGISILDELGFVQVDELTIRWRLQAFGKEWFSQAQSESAHLDSDQQIIFFAKREDGTFPWAAISRELTFALAASENPASISPGLKGVLEADTLDDAKTQLGELGIESIQIFDRGTGEGAVVDTLGNDGTGTNGRNPLGNGIPNLRQDNGKTDGSEDSQDWFARHLYGVQTTTPSSPPDNPVMLPLGGPNTSQSAIDYTDRSNRVGRDEPHVLRLVKRHERGPKGQALEKEFRDMIRGDYGERCQICTRSFTTTGGRSQLYICHLVPPKQGHLTNNLGGLLGLCGWHFSLFQYGEWAFLDPDTEKPFEDGDGTSGWARMRSFIWNRTEETDERENVFIGLPIRFSNVYQEWRPEPTHLMEQVRYSIPHWKFFCELLRQ